MAAAGAIDAATQGPTPTLLVRVRRLGQAADADTMRILRANLMVLSTDGLRQHLAGRAGDPG